MTTPTTTQMPYQHLQQYRPICRRFGFLILFLTPFSFVAVVFLRRHEKSEDGTKSPWYERYEKSKAGTKSPWYESSMVRKVHKWYETSMVRKVYGTKSLVPHETMFHLCEVTLLVLASLWLVKGQPGTVRQAEYDVFAILRQDRSYVLWINLTPSATTLDQACIVQ